MIHIFEACVFVGYSFLAPIITAGGSMLVTNFLNIFGGIYLIKATGLTSASFMINAIISLYIFKKDIVWRDVKNILPMAIIGSFIGSLFLVNINPTILLSLMFVFSLYYIYKKIKIMDKVVIQKDSLLKEMAVGLFAGSVTGAALPGGGFLNAYFASKGFTLQQMYATLNFTLIFVWIVKVSVMLNSGILIPSDLIGAVIAAPFLIGSNYLVRRGLIKLSKSATDKITILAMSIFSIYALVIIVKSFI